MKAAVAQVRLYNDIGANVLSVSTVLPDARSSERDL
jgi:hypothetical protein